MISSILAVLPYADTSSQNTNECHSNADKPYKHIESHMYQVPFRRFSIDIPPLVLEVLR